MHELSIANSIVDIVTDQLQAEPTPRVTRVNLRVGALSCLHRDSLLFSFDLITAGTCLEGAKLHFTELPVKIYCPNCDRLQTLAGVQAFRCPECQTPSADIRQGQELEIESIELADSSTSSDATAPSEASPCLSSIQG